MTAMTAMTPDERELWNERVAIMLAEFNPAGMSDEQVEAATVAIEVVATNEILRRRQVTVDARKKRQTGFKFGGEK